MKDPDYVMNMMESWMPLDDLEVKKNKNTIHGKQWYELNEDIYLHADIWNTF